MNIPGTGLLKAAAAPAAAVLRSLGVPTEPATSRRHRRVRATGAGRVHLAMRGLRGKAGGRAAEAVERRLAELPGVRWAAVNAVLGTVVIALEGPEDDEETLRALMDVVEDVEDVHDLGGHPVPSHPGSPAPARRAAWAMASQAVAIPLALAGRVVSMSPVPVELAALVSVVETNPRLRRLVARAVGERNAGLILTGLGAAAQAAAGGLLSLGVDTARHAMRTAELGAHRSAWDAAEPRLTGNEAHAGAEYQEPGEERGTPLRDGPVERYADRAPLVAAAAFAGVLAMTRRPRAAADAALAAIPKAPWLAREGFTATLGGALAHRGTVVHRPEALRLMDRIGAVVLDASVLATGAYVLADLVPLDGEVSGGELAAAAHRLFDPRRPDRLVREEAGGVGWSLGPVDVSAADPPADPAGRAAPADPAAPVNSAPVNRVAPMGAVVGPAASANPGAPVDSTDRADPADPADPMTPAVPADPPDPADRADPAVPADPAALLDPTDPADPADRAAPADLAARSGGAEAVARAGERLARDGAALVLGLARAGRPVAVVSVVPEIGEAAENLVSAARGCGLRVVVTGAGADSPPAVPDADELAPADEPRAATVRRLQADGTGVLAVCRDRRALGAADIGVGVAHPDGRPAWGADVYVRAPAEAVVVVEACGPARAVAERGVRLAQAAAGLGGAVTLAGRSRRMPARSLAAVNWAGAAGLGYGAWRAAEVLRRPHDRPVSRQPWHAMPVETVLARTATAADRGLTDRQARSRAAAGGEPTRPPSLVRAVAAEMANPLTPVLAGGAALSAAVGGVLDAVIVLAVTGVSGLIGGTQRHITDRAVRELHQRSAVTAGVVRDGEERTVQAAELVVGDIIALGSGDVVPADCRLLEGPGLEADESALTGESLPVAKSVEPVLSADVAERASMLYEGTTLVTGQARAVVVATGETTEAGRGARAGRGAAPKVGVERRLAQLTRTTLPLALGSAGAVMAAGLLRGRPARQTVGAGVGLAVASVPEGLPFLVSAAQLAAARRLSAEGVLVRDPRTIEAAGRADVLCFDKTGTLTHGRIELGAVSAADGVRPLDGLGESQRRVLAAALRATPRPRRGRRLEHFTDRAVADGAQQTGVTRGDGAPGWRRGASLPFEPSRSFHATCGRGGLLSVKGAPEEVLGRCALDRTARQRLLGESERLAAAGNRVLAVAERAGDHGGTLTDDAVRELDFLGFLLLTDQVRGGAARSVRRLAEAGVHIVMITGDHPQTAESIARELDVVDGRRVVTGAELDALDDAALDELLPHVGVVARGTPAHKVRVVRAFQRIGRTVAMTGDGANDAPAIRLADVGICLGRRGSPAARAAADLVVTDDRLETILAALVEGRAMWASVRQAIAILIGGNLGEIGFTVLSAAVTGSSPLTARQLLLVNLFTDLAPAIAIALRPPGEEGERRLREGPEASLGTALTDEIAVRAMATALGAAAAWIVARFTGRAARARTIALAALVGTQLGQTLLVGGGSRAVLAASAGSMAALAAVIQTPGVSHFFGCTPLGPVGWGLALACAAAATAGSVFLPPVARRVRAAVAAVSGARLSAGTPREGGPAPEGGGAVRPAAAARDPGHGPAPAALR